MLCRFKSTFILSLCFSQQPCETDKADTVWESEPWISAFLKSPGLKVVELELKVLFILVNTNSRPKHHSLCDFHPSLTPTMWALPLHPLSSISHMDINLSICDSVVYLNVCMLAFPYQVVSLLR